MQYGVEIEINRTSCSMQELAEKIAAKGLECTAEGYNHRTNAYWKVTTDATCGYEVVSPILYGEDGFAQIEKVCEALAEAGAKIDRSCGLHVHHDASELDVDTFKNLAVFYKKYEKVIDKFMPASRRTGNRWIKSLRGISLSAIERAETIQQLVGYVFSNRYRKLNFRSYVRHGTIEFRHHSGSVEAKKIIAWVKMTNAMIERAKAGRVNVSRATLQNFFRNMFEGVAVEPLAVEPTPRRAPRAGTMAAVAYGLFEMGWNNEEIFEELRERFPEARSLNRRRVNQMRNQLMPNEPRVVEAAPVANNYNNELIEFYTARAAHFEARGV